MIRFVPPFKTRYIASISGGVTENIARVGVAIGVTCAATVVHDASASASVSVSAQAKGHFTYFAIADVTISATAAGQRTAGGTANIGVDITTSADATTFTAHSGTADVSVAIGATASATTITPIEGVASCSIEITTSAESVVRTIRYGTADCQVNIAASSSGRSISAFTNSYSVDVSNGGTNALQLVSDDSIFDFGTNDFTLSVWFKVNNFTYSGNSGLTHERILSAHVGSGDTWFMYASGNGGLGLYGAGNTYVDAGSSNVSTDTWYLGTITRSGNTVTVYVNSTQVAQETKTGSYESYDGTGGGVMAGRDPLISNAGAYDMDGLVSNIGVWDEALTSSEVTALYNGGNPIDLITNSGNYTSSSGLTGYWRLEEGTGTSSADVTSNNNTATLLTGASWSTDYPESTTLSGTATCSISVTASASGHAFTTHSGTASCQVNLSASASGTVSTPAMSNDYSVNLDGTNDYIEADGFDAHSIIGTGALTLSVWFKRDTSTSTQALVYIGESGGNHDYLYIDVRSDSRVRVTYREGTGGGFSVHPTDTTTNATWHHLVTTRSGTTSKLYLDGTEIGSGTHAEIGANLGDSSSLTKFGAWRTGGSWYDGKVDEIAIWDVALSSADVTAIYNSGAPNDLTDSGSYDTDRSGDLQGYWRFEENTGTSIADSSGNSRTATLTNGPTFSTDAP